MKKIFIIFALFSLLSINANAFVFLQGYAIEGMQQNTSGTLRVTPGEATKFRIQFSVTRNNSGNFDSFKLEIVHTEGSSQTVIKEVSYLGHPWQNSYFLDGIFDVTLPADKQKGEIVLRITAYNGNQSSPSTSNYKYTLNNGITPTDPPPPTPNSYLDNPYAREEFIGAGTGARYRTTRKPSREYPPSPQSPGVWYPDAKTPILSPGQSIYSQNGQYRMVIQSYDGVLLLLRVSDGQVLWSNKKTGGAYLFFYPDGNLVMFNSSNQMVWSSDIYILSNHMSSAYNNRTYFVFQNDGNFVMNWNGGTYTDVVGATGTGGGVTSVHFGSMKL